MRNKFYLTNSIPYVNAKPHIGHALEFVQSDVLYRYHKLIGDSSFLLCGSDENAIKNVQAAEAAGKPIQEFIDDNAQLFQDLAESLDIHFDTFQKGSNTKTHYPSSQKLWELCQKSGDIYKKAYKGLYCVGCETFYTEEELNDKGECFEHPGKKLEEVAESNYFFKLSRYQEQLIDLIKRDTVKIIPATRKNEVLAFLKEPLQDISISRSNTRARNWGVPVPGDNTQRMYVWFDALNIYQSGVGFGWDEKTYQKWWPADGHVIGKGILRFHAVYWPAFLLSAGLSLPKTLYVHGYITIDGQKMSKTLGNVIDPIDIIEKYGREALRYYFLREVPTIGDGDFSYSRMNEIYSSDLSNELGNLLVRLTTLAEQDGIVIDEAKQTKYKQEIGELIETFQYNRALEEIWQGIKALNREVDEYVPWKKQPAERKNFLVKSLQRLSHIGYLLSPFIPQTGDRIQSATQGTIKKAQPLFPRL